MLNLCLIMLVWTCSTKYAPLVIVCMKFYHLLLDSVMICVSVLMHRYYPNVVITYTRIGSWLSAFNELTD